MKLYSILISILLLPALLYCKEANNESKPNSDNNKVQLASDQLLHDYYKLIKHKHIGLVTNHTALLSNGIHLADTLSKLKDVKLVALFGPEHGIRGDAPAGEKVESSIDKKTGVPAYSLYGKNKMPTKEMLKGIDLLIFDIQDVGARFYTYISTLYYSLQCAAQNHIPIIVLDRPNPINGINVQGPVLDTLLKSFVGIAPIPIMHGMTTGELAKYFYGEGLLGKNLKLDLTVIKLKNWKRNFYYDDCNLRWISPSPNIPDVNTAIVYPGMCLFEGTNVSEGRGTNAPFMTIGAPYIESNEVILLLNIIGSHNGVYYEPVDFTPKDIEGKASNPKYKNELCHGIKLVITDRNSFNAVKNGIQILYAINKIYPQKFVIKDGFDRLAGDKSVKQNLLKGLTPDKIIDSWQNNLKSFLTIRKKYLLYN